ncbi:MAG: endonuclease MutS2 [Armatimonadota bacterium]|nr:endonuclease MutS2 [Armatimonadota bacterium]
MDQHTLTVLEFDKIIARLAQQAACALGREKALLTQPTSCIETAKIRQRETTEAKAILEQEGAIPLGGIEDIRPYLERASIGAMLQPTELLAVQSTLAAARRLGSFLTRLRDKYPTLGELGARIEFFEDIEEAISQSINQSAEVVDSASSNLARVRSELRSLHARLTERLHSLIQSREYRAVIQQPVVTMRNDRYCIPIKSEYRGAFPGIVHDASTSGATLFVEPAALVELGNRRKELIAREREEVEKVLSALSARVGAEAGRIRTTLETVGEVDYITARARLSLAMNAVQPILNNLGMIRLAAARHPLLSGDVVPIDVELGKRFSALLITGPNTGGKTVTLKTIGLLSLMAASGLHIPAAIGSETAVFDSIFADIGDEQSIEQSLSTFSSHMSNIVRITQQAGSNSLVLLDEIGAGTDPAEGAALAKAVLDYLMTRGAKIVATTHYGELKEFAYLRDGMENASVEFDPETLRPTYKLVIGVPGSSNAFAIATRLGLANEIIAAARENLSQRTEAADELIRRIEESHRIAAEQRRLAEIASRDANVLKRRYEERLAKLEATRQKIEDKAREKAEELINRYAKQLDRTLEQLAEQTRESKHTQRLKQKAERLLARMENELVEPVEQRRQKEEMLPAGTELKPGTRVRIAGVDRDGVIVEPPEKGKVVVLVGSMRVTVAVKNLRKPRANEQPPLETKLSDAHSQIALEKARTFSPELHLRGLRVEAGILAVSKYLDDAMTVGADTVRIVHGKGTGQMRSAVHQYLSSHPAVASFRLADAAEGGSGVTVVEMKK